MSNNPSENVSDWSIFQTRQPRPTTNSAQTFTITTANIININIAGQGRSSYRLLVLNLSSVPVRFDW
jgi:hypothetical protein